MLTLVLVVSLPSWPFRRSTIRSRRSPWSPRSSRSRLRSSCRCVCCRRGQHGRDRRLAGVAGGGHRAAGAAGRTHLRERRAAYGQAAEASGGLAARAKLDCRAVRRAALLVALGATRSAAAAPAQAAPPGCDPLDPAHCLLPWPNDHFRKDGKLALRKLDDAAQQGGPPIAAADYNCSNGFSPGQIIVTLVPRLDLRRTGAVPVNDMALAQAQAGDRRDRRQDRQAPADLGGARLAGQGPPQARPARPPGHAGARAGATSSPSATSRRQGTHARAHGGVPRLRDGLPRGRARSRRRPHMEDIFSRLGKAGDPPPQPLPRLGLHGRQRAQPVAAHAVDPQPAFAELGDRNLATSRSGRPRPPSPSTAARTPGTAAASTAPSPCPASSTRPAARPARASSSAATGCRSAPPATCRRSASSASCRTPPPPRPRGRSSSATGCSARGGRSLAPLAPARNFVACATDWSGMSTEDLPNVLGPVGRPLALPDARRPQPTGLPQLHVPRPADGPSAGPRANAAFGGRDRHAPALLRRRQPGRDPRRRADGGRARLRPLGADRAGDELQPAAHAQHPVHVASPTCSTASYPDQIERARATR